MRHDTLAFLQQETFTHQAAQVHGYAYTLLENLKDQLDPYMKGWLPIDGDDKSQVLLELRPEDLRRESVKMYYRNAHGRVVIRNLVKFIIGKGIIIDFHEKDEENI